MIYKKLLNNEKDPNTQLRQRWEADLGEMEDEDWADALTSPREVAIRARYKLIQLKVLHRVYYTPATRLKMGIATTDLCTRGCGERGTFLHILWDCDKVQNYWRQLQEIITEVLGEETTLTPKLCLLNIWEPTDLTRPKRKWLTLAMTIAKRNVARLWGAEQPPRREEWEQDLDWAMLAEKVTYEGRGCPNKWRKIWTEWGTYRGIACMVEEDIE